MSKQGAARVLAIAKERGLEVVLRDDGRPALRGPAEERTPALMEALKQYRAEIIGLIRSMAGSEMAVANAVPQSPVT